MGVVRPSWSPYNSPAMVVKKKDGGWRCVIDYRRINEVTVKEPYPIPRADEAFDALAKAKYMSTFDLTSGYWQIPLREEVRKQKKAAKERYDKNRKDSPYRVGHLVWLDRPKMTPNENRKLATKWSGPYRIFNVVDKNALIVDIQHLENPQDQQRVNVNRLKKAIFRPGDILPEDIDAPVEKEEMKKEKEEELEKGMEQLRELIDRVKKEAKVEKEEEKEKEATTEEPLHRSVRNRRGRTIFSQQNRDKNDPKNRAAVEIPEEVEVEKILGERTNRKKKTKEYLLKWKGYPESHNEWVAEKHMHADRLLQEWKRAQKLNPKKERVRK